MAAIYYEYIVKGNEDALCAYIGGFLRGKGIKEGCYFSKDCPFHRHHIREIIEYHGDVIHLICRSNLRSTIESAIRQSAAQHEFEIKETHKIAKVSFRFKFETANRSVAGTIKRALGRLPADVKLVDYEPKEEVTPKAKGPEGYAPLHAYFFTGEGVVEGDVAGVLKVHEKLSNHEFVKCDDIEIHH
jgi:hypothetical protein